MKAKKNYFKYVAMVLAVVFLVTAALMFLEIWDNRQGRFAESDAQDGVVTYEGQDYVLKTGVETFLVLGLDKYEGESVSDSHGSGVQADFLMLFVIDNEAQQFSAIHINRDTMANVNKLGIGATKIETFTKQIALAYHYVADGSDKIRCRNTKDSVEDLLHGVDVNHYLSVTMDAVPTMNDFIGGVEVTVLDDFTGIDDALVKGETVTLTGEQALHYVRTRYGLEDSSNSTRMARQQQYINALYAKTMSCIQADDAFTINLISTMDDYVVYDSSDSKMQKLAEKLDEYQFMGIREIEGNSVLGEEFIEFYPDEASVWEIVIDLFYTPKGA